MDRGQLEDVRELVARGDLAAFDSVPVQLKLDVPRGVGAELQRFARGGAEMPTIRRQGQAFHAADSLLAFALLAITRELDLVAPILPLAIGSDETSCARPARFIRRLLLAQPLF